MMVTGSPAHVCANRKICWLEQLWYEKWYFPVGAVLKRWVCPTVSFGDSSSISRFNHLATARPMRSMHGASEYLQDLAPEMRRPYQICIFLQSLSQAS